MRRGFVVSTLLRHRALVVAILLVCGCELALGAGLALADVGSGTENVLPDGRVYELVSPPDKNGGNIGTLFGGSGAQASPDGEAVTYTSTNSFSTSQSAELLSQYLSERHLTGWTTRGISPPANPLSSVSLSNPYEAFSADLSAGVLAWTDPTLVPGATDGYRNLYVRDNATDSYQLITTVVPQNRSESRFMGASSDFSHIVFQSEDALTEGAVANARNVYEWYAGRLSLVSVPPNSATGAPNASLGDGEDAQGAVSSDGTLIFWAAAGQLYVREHGAVTVKINASQRTSSLGEDGSASFYGATSSGARVLFADKTPLTNVVDDKGGLYELETKTGKLTDLTPDGGESPGLLGVLGYSDDGSSVYFVATGDLTVGATARKPNLYLAGNGSLTFIATLSENDSAAWAHQPTSRRAAVTPDGAHVVFMSDASLTGYDDVDANSKEADTEVFEYDAPSQQLHCLSCNPSRRAPLGPASVPSWLNSNYNPRYLSEDGNRVFFDSSDALVAHATNGVQNVYEWERSGTCGLPLGCLYLISSGSSEAPSGLVDASADGHDVFFTTQSSLVPADIDEQVDLYDARVGGGFPAISSSSSCAGEACQGRLTAAPTPVSPLTETSQSIEEQEDGSAPPASLRIVSVRPDARLARTGRITLSVRVSHAGKITAKIGSIVRGRDRQIASALAQAAKAGTVKVSLTMVTAARRLLADHHRLKVTVTVAFSPSQHPQRLAVTLHDQGGRG